MSRSGQMRPLRGHLFWCILTSLTDFLLLSLRSLDHWSTSPGIVREAQTTLHDLEDVRIVLAGLLASLEATIVDMKKRIHPLVHGMGLASIPDEILSEIFEYELELNDIVSTSKTTGTLSLVCRRFRRVALNTPRLWSRISKSDKMPYVRGVGKSPPRLYSQRRTKLPKFSSGAFAQLDIFGNRCIRMRLL